MTGCIAGGLGVVTSAPSLTRRPVHGLLAWEIDAIMDIAERWGPVDRSHSKLAHRGSYTGQVWVAASTVRRVLAAHGLVLPELPARARSHKRPWPQWLVWAPNGFGPGT